MNARPAPLRVRGAKEGQQYQTCLIPIEGQSTNDIHQGHEGPKKDILKGHDEPQMDTNGHQ